MIQFRSLHSIFSTYHLTAYPSKYPLMSVLSLSFTTSALLLKKTHVRIIHRKSVRSPNQILNNPLHNHVYNRMCHCFRSRHAQDNNSQSRQLKLYFPLHTLSSDSIRYSESSYIKSTISIFWFSG